MRCPHFVPRIRPRGRRALLGLVGVVASSLIAAPAEARPDPSLMDGIPWEIMERHTVVPHAVRSGWVEHAIRHSAGVTLAEAYTREGIAPEGCPPRLQIFKSQFVMVATACGRFLKIYPVSLSGTPVGTKLRLGDRRTPEGKYTLLKHVSPTYGLCLFVCYPNWVDAFRGFLANDLTYTQFRHIELALQAGVPPPQDTPLGAQILVHTSRTRSDTCSTCDNWSFGCIVMEPRDLDELLGVIPWGSRTDLTIHPVDVALEPSLLSLGPEHDQSQTNE